MDTYRLERYPFPLAFTARLFDVAPTPADRLDKAAHFIEMTAVTLGVVILGWGHVHSVSSDGIRNWGQAVEPRGVALGRWIDVLRLSREAMASRPHDPLARAVHLGADAVLPYLERFNPQRNVYAHGGRPRLAVDVDAAAGDLVTIASAMLDGLEPLAQVRLGVVRACQPRPGGRAHRVDVDVMAGAAELFERRSFGSVAPFGPGTVVAYHRNSLNHAVALHPFCIWRACTRCTREELFYLNRRKKSRSDHFSFTTGHELRLRGENRTAPATPAVSLGMEGIGARQAAATRGWRASWVDLAHPARRAAARGVDTVVFGVILAVAGLLALATGLGGWPSAGIAVTLAAAYEPVAAALGGTWGKRLLRIEPISTNDGRALGRRDAVVRAALADLQLLVPLVGCYNLAWLLGDPARQCLHDRVTASVVVTGRSRPGQKV
jgi:hypothetical protein